MILSMGKDLRGLQERGERRDLCSSVVYIRRCGLRFCGGFVGLLAGCSISFIYLNQRRTNYHHLFSIALKNRPIFNLAFTFCSVWFLPLAQDEGEPAPRG